MPTMRRTRVQHSVLLVGGAADPLAQTGPVLERHGFAAPERVGTLGEAASRLRTGAVDLLVLPLGGLGTTDLALVERELRPRATCLLGTAPGATPELILAAMRAGVHEFVPSPVEPQALAPALERLVGRMLGLAGAGGRILAVYSAKGGLGTTTVAVNLATAIARQHPDRQVALVDFVVVGGDVRVLLDLKPTYDVGDLVMKLERVDAELLHSLLGQGPGGVWTLPSAEQPEVLDLVDAGAAGTILGQLRAHFAEVVVDTEHALTERTLAALDAADRIILVTQLSVPALRSAQRTLQVFERLGYAPGKVAVVVNRANAETALKVADAEAVLGRAIDARLPNEFRTCVEATTRGVSVLAQKPHGALARAYLDLATRLAGTTPAAAAARAAPSRRVVRAGRS